MNAAGKINSRDILFSVMIFSLLFVLFSRGLFEFLTGSKEAAFIIEFLSSASLLVIAALVSRINVKGNSLVFIIVYLSFALAVVVSCLLTLARFRFIYEIVFFSLVMLYLFFIFSFFNILSCRDMKPEGIIGNSISVTGIILVLFMVFELAVRLTGFPGEAVSLTPAGIIYRPASLTGSYLHLPIIMPLLGAAALRFAGKRYLKLSGIVFLLVPFLVFSRSGMIISAFVFAGLAAVIIKDAGSRGRILRILIPLLCLAAAVTIVLIAVKPLRSYAATLAVRIFIFNDKGNISRFSIWSSGLNAFFKTNMIFGEYTGFSSNIVNNFFHNELMAFNSPLATTTLESGLLEMILSYGILGAVLYYGSLIFSAVMNMKRGEMLLSFTTAGVIIETLFYQSVEILPFVFAVSLIQFLVNSRSDRSLKIK